MRIIWGVLLWGAVSAHAFPNYYEFEHEITIAGHHFSMVIVLPQYFARNFGMLDELDFELRLQDVHPIPDAKIHKTLEALQNNLWRTYNQSPFLKGKDIFGPKFDTFRGIERFTDGRSAIFAIVEKEKPGTVSEVPFTLEAMVRMSSPIDLTATEPIDRLFQELLPFDLRVLLSDEGLKQRQKYPRPIVARFGNRKVGYVPIFLEDEAVLGRAESEVACWEGAPLELKAWYHQPKVIKQPDGKNLIIDFIPDLLEVALMYGGFDRTGLSTASLAHDEFSKLGLEKIVSLVSRLNGKPATSRDIGIRAGEFWTEVIELPLANREQEDFDMDLRLHFDDPHFTGYKNHVLWSTRERLLPALSTWASKRPGAKLLPFSRLIVKNRRESLSCGISLLHPGVRQLVSPDLQIQGIGVYLK